MNLKTFVKVGNVSNLSDARYCAGSGVNLLGFNIDPNDEDSISLETVKEIMGWVSVDGFVLECGEMAVTEIRSVLDACDAQYVQVDQADIAEELSKNGVEVILRSIVKDQISLGQAVASVNNCFESIKFWLIESSNIKLNDAIQSRLKEIGLSVAVLNGFDVTAENAVEITDNDIYAGIALKGSKEEKPGFKDYDELADVLEVLEDDD